MDKTILLRANYREELSKEVKQFFEENNTEEVFETIR